MNRRRATGGSASLGLSVLVVWLFGHFGVSMSAEMGTIVGGMAIAAGAAIWAEGIRGVLVHIWWGDDDHHGKVIVEAEDATKVTIEEHEGSP